jgi:DNA-binding NtrC family response regulator
MNSQLDSVIDEKIRPLVQAYQQKYLGVKVSEIEQDISDQLKQSTLLDLPIDVKMPYRQAKKAFKRAYLLRMLQLHLGNISTAADAAGIDRRSIHRMVHSLRLPATRMRENVEPMYVRKSVVQGIIQDVAGQYRPALHPAKYKAFSTHSEALSEEIVKELPEAHLSLKEAERAFEREYFTRLLAQSTTIAAVAKQAKLRYEVVHRKLKMLGIRG